MVKSMTGFGRYEAANEDYKVIVELKSVNHRYFDLSVKLPKKLNVFEQKIRTMLKTNIGRGKVDAFISYENYADTETTVRYHSHVIKGYMDAFTGIAEEFSVDAGTLNSYTLARLPEVISLEENTWNVEPLEGLIEEAVDGALKQFILARENEGCQLKSDLLSKLDLIESYVDYVEARSPQIIEEYRAKISNKVAELLGDKKIDDTILATELTIFADKVCVDEETVRLRSHILNMRNTLENSEPVGRKLDFISQEMNREANTILSKANDRDLSNKAIDLKTEIEKIREQIQNIE